jgi:hypothetical protein
LLARSGLDPFGTEGKAGQAGAAVAAALVPDPVQAGADGADAEVELGGDLGVAVIESWHSTLEFELRRARPCATRQAARARVAAWIDDYNRHRRHSALQMMSPVDYEQALAAGEAA